MSWMRWIEMKEKQGMEGGMGGGYERVEIKYSL